MDLPDYFRRSVTGRSHWPPLSLRSFVGGGDFDEVGTWYVKELTGLGLLKPKAKILDIGCGCGRVAYAMAMDDGIRKQEISYEGMDVDRAVVRWCEHHIASRNQRFHFYHADCFNPSYNPQGRVAATDYHFPHPQGSFDLILLSSVLTHVLEDELQHYLSEVARLLTPEGAAYSTFFLFNDRNEARAGLERHGIAFPFDLDRAAVNRLDYPHNAVAYPETFVRAIAKSYGLDVIEPTRYGIQDVLLFRRTSSS